MKKSLIVSACAALILMTGCGKTTSEEISAGMSGTFCSERGIVFSEGGFVKFTDFKSGESAFVCSKPDCRHNDDSCLAYYDTPVFENVYGDSLYVLDDETLLNESVLYKSDKDGSDRKKLCTLEVDGSLNTSYIISADRLYMFGSKTDTRTNDMTYYPVIVNLEDGTYSVGDEISQDNSVSLLFADGENSQMIYSLESTKLDVKQYMENGSTEELDKLLEDPENINFDVYTFSFDSGKSEHTEGFDSSNKAVFYDGENFITRSADFKSYRLTDKKGETKENLLTSDSPVTFSCFSNDTLLLKDTADGTVYLYNVAEKKLDKTKASDIPAYIYGEYAIFDSGDFCSLEDWKSGSYSADSSESTADMTSNTDIEYSEPVVLDDTYFSEHWQGKTVLHILSDSLTVCDTVNAAFNDRLCELGADYVVDFEYSAVADSQEYLQELESRKNSGDDTDIFSSGILSEADENKNLYTYCAENGLCQPLDDYFKTDEGKTFYDSYSETMWKCVTIDGKIYGFTGAKDIGSGLCINYYGDSAAPEGITKLSDLNDFLSENSQSSPAFYIDKAFGEYIKNQGGILVGNSVPVRISSEGITAFNPYTHDFFKDYVSFVYNGKQQGTVGTDLKATVFVGSLKPDSEDVKQIKISGIEAYAAPIETDVWCVSSWSENAEFAENLFTLLSEDEQLNNLLYYGIEGVSYSCDDGKVTVTDTEDIFGSQATMGNELLLIENKPLKEEYESYNDSLEILDLSRYDFSEFDEDFAEFSAIITEYDDILTGESEDFENRLEELTERLDKAGFNRVIDRINETLTAN